MNGSHLYYFLLSFSNKAFAVNVHRYEMDFCESEMGIRTGSQRWFLRKDSTNDVVITIQLQSSAHITFAFIKNCKLKKGVDQFTR